MTSQSIEHNTGLIGISVLIMMAVALIGGQVDASNAAAPTAGSVEAPPTVAPAGYRMGAASAPQVLDRAKGAIREISVIPSRIADYSEFQWTADDALIREYCNAAC